MLPVIDTEWRGRVFISTVRGVGINWVHTSDTLFGPRITYDAGRKESLDASLAGTGDIKSGYEAGLFFVHFSGPWRFDSDIRQRVTSGPKAVRATLGATIGGPIAANANLFFGGRVEYDGSKYNEAYYLDAGAGITNVITYMAVVRELGGGTYLGFDGQVGRLLGPASRTPSRATPFTSPASPPGTGSKLEHQPRGQAEEAQIPDRIGNGGHEHGGSDGRVHPQLH